MPIAGLSLILADPLSAQTFRTLHTFTGSDGTDPGAGVIWSGTTLYGTTSLGGTSGFGTLFKVSTNGAGFAVLYTFTAADASDINSDGGYPRGALVSAGTNLYGTTTIGGTGAQGTVFAINTDGSGFTNLHSFTGADDGGRPSAGLILSGNILFGTAYSGGGGHGTVFALGNDGTSFTTLYSFTGADDGANPFGPLTLSGNTLFGTTLWGGSSASGTVFSLNTNGMGFKTIYSFKGGNDGANPKGNLILVGNSIYGVASGGGSLGNGTLFSIKTDGTGFAALHTFNGTNDGGVPGALAFSGTKLYGVAASGGSSSRGTVFAANADGTAFTVLHTFNSGTDGASPYGLILSDNALYGTADSFGTGSGTVFSISLPATVSPPQMSINLTGSNVILSWPTSANGFNLHSSTNLGPSAIWTTISSPATVINGQNIVTNPISGTQQFFRLSQ